MSLLLEALKKAELAKQGTQSAASAPAEIEFAPSSKTAGQPIITRENLPDITQQLEILSEDLPSSASSQASAEAAPPQRTSAPAPNRSMPKPIFAEEPAEPAQEQAAAKQLFDAKGLEDYNPRKPFYYTVGALGVFAVGAIGYFWWQLQPRYIVAPTAVANAPARPPEPITPAATIAPAPAPVDPLANPGPSGAPPGPAPAGVSTAATNQPEHQNVQPVAAVPAPGTVAQVTSANSPVVISKSAPPAVERAAGTPRPRPHAAGSRVTPSTSPATRTDEQLERAFDAYQKGDLTTARQAYADSLKIDPSNRDAMLGLAAIDARSGQVESAETRYLKLLESDPRDAHALAGLIALRGQADPVQSESRLKSLIANQPEAGFLHFALGNQMALQARWPEAQAAYFKALASEPDNPDYAYNLAVSLDHIRQGKLALDYYQKALALGSARPSTFDRTRATTRIRELQQ